MTPSKRIFLVVVDESKEMPVALRYAARRAMDVKGQVALLSVVEPEEIGTWGGVERAMTDEAFAAARGRIAQLEKELAALGAGPPLTYFRKGERVAALLDVIESEPLISVLVLAAQTEKDGRNPLIQFLTSEKGLRKLKIPLIIVPDTCRPDDTSPSDSVS